MAGFDLHQITSPFAGLNVTIGSVSIGYNWFFAVGFVIVALIALFVLLKKTKIGLAISATSQKGDAATLMGINIKHVYIFTFALGAALAGAAGALYGMVFAFDPYVALIQQSKRSPSLSSGASAAPEVPSSAACSTASQRTPRSSSSAAYGKTQSPLPCSLWF